jgi:hypothetical protein
VTKQRRAVHIGNSGQMKFAANEPDHPTSQAISVATPGSPSQTLPPQSHRPNQVDTRNQTVPRALRITVASAHVANPATFAQKFHATTP